MQREATSKNIDGIADLVVVAPIKDGFIRAYENVTYDTRLRLVAEALHKVRIAAREHEPTTPFADTTERILTLLDFRIGVLDDHYYQLDDKDGLAPRRFLFLAATFDGAWEPYMRLIWQPLGSFLDLLFCNCEGYVTAGDHSFAEYAAWVRAHQVDSAIFYSTTGITVRDQLYLSKLESLQRGGADNDLAIARARVDHPDDLAAGERAKAETDAAVRFKLNELALEALTVLYRLADYFPPDRLVPTEDDPDAEGRYLLRVARALLDGWEPDKLPDAVQNVYREPLQWYRSTHSLASTQPRPEDPKPDWSEVQGGMLKSYGSDERPVTQGALLLMGITEPAAAQRFIAGLGPQYEADGPPADGVYRNIAFTRPGLGRIGVREWVLRHFPKEFRDGMADRSGLLGDMRENHPRRWRLPRRHRRKGSGPLPPVELDEVDFLIQLRIAPGPEQDGAKLLAETIATLEASAEGAMLLAVEEMVSLAPLLGVPGASINHLGFHDGLSQPAARHGPPPPAPDPDDVRLGELLCGYGNDQGDTADPDPRARKRLIHNGSFLVVRKTGLDVAAFDEFLENESKKVARELDLPWFNREELAARLMGRYRDGRPLIRPDAGRHNRFDYETDDPDGDKCPYASHIRRTNPRNQFLGRPAPRLFRRGMSYGPLFEEEPEAPRGIMFMAYNASIAEQFEVIQRWINGGNSSGVAAAQNDPIMGVRPRQGAHIFRFVVDGKVARVEIPKPFSSLEWGAYFFVPSRAALRAICDAPPVRSGEDLREQAGRTLIQRLRHLTKDAQQLEWKRILEDFDTKDPAERRISPDVWSAIRYYYHGAYRIEEGVQLYDAKLAGLSPELYDRNRQPVVLVGSFPLILKVLNNWKVFSTEEQLDRIDESSGSIYVAQQPDDRYVNAALHSNYVAESVDTNAILMGFGTERAFRHGYAAAKTVLDKARATARAFAHEANPGSNDSPYFEMELRREFLMPALAGLCHAWFGIPDGVEFEAGGWRWDADAEAKPRCPGDFLSPSRHAFYPRPTLTVAKYGRRHGRAIAAGGRAFVARNRKLEPQDVPGSVACQMFARTSDDDVLARNLIGIMVGALPPMDGCLRGILYDWLHDRTLWRHQAALHRAAGSDGEKVGEALETLLPAIAEAICKRPAPDLIYRTAVSDFELDRNVGDAEALHIKKGDLVILGLVSAAQRTGDVFSVFGGDRSRAGHPPHACPAYKMAMGGMAGIIAALLDSGRIQALPASLIVRIS